VNGHIFSVAQLGPGLVMLRDALDHPPGEGRITMSIDGDQTEWPVDLVDGIVAGRTKTRIAKQPSTLNGTASH
jgi:hypothetical protein